MTAASRGRALIAAIAAASVLALAACSSTDSSTTAGSEASTAGSLSESAESSAPYSGLNTAAQSSEAEANTGTAPAPETTAPPATTPVPAPGGGDINQTVPEVEITSNSPVPLTETADFGNGVTVNLAAIQSITTEAQLPGEIAGPGVQVTVDIVNSSSDAIDLGAVIVDLADAAGTPAIPMSASPASPFVGSLAAGQTATGVYVFTVPSTYANPATVSVSYSTKAPVAVFVGDAK